jgi:hypothetical protein
VEASSWEIFKKSTIFILQEGPNGKDSFSFPFCVLKGLFPVIFPHKKMTNSEVNVCIRNRNFWHKQKCAASQIFDYEILPSVFSKN